MKRFSYLMLAACLTFPVTGCGGDATKTDGPAVNPPANADDAGSDVKDAAKEAIDATEDAAKDAIDATEDAAKKVKEAVE